MREKQYIFGYGSLIEQKSRQRTTPNIKTIIPAEIDGFKRGWFARTKTIGLSTTFLGCIPDLKSKLNGILYEINPEELNATDLRENGYDRIEIPFENITFYSKPIEYNSKIWIYSNSFSENKIPDDYLPSKKYPIVQSYVDICLNGCIEIEDLFPKAKEADFTKQFIQTTHFWNEHWVNDRIYPRRPFIHQKNAYKIDELLLNHLPDKSLVDKIYFE